MIQATVSAISSGSSGSSTDSVKALAASRVGSCSIDSSSSVCTIPGWMVETLRCPPCLASLRQIDSKTVGKVIHGGLGRAVDRCLGECLPSGYRRYENDVTTLLLKHRR